MCYFETVHHEPGEAYPTATAHATLEEAIEYAGQHNATTIYGIGRSWIELCKCSSCKEWVEVDRMHMGLCFDCLRAIEEHSAWP